MRRLFPNFDEFSALAAKATIVPIYRQLLADRLTPVSAFEALRREQHAFLLESVVGGEKIGRYSFIAAGPQLVYQVIDEKASIQDVGKNPQEFTTTDPLADLQKLLPAQTYHRDPNLPAFTGGLVGYAGYDTIRYYERESLPSPPKDDRRLPDLLFGLYGELVIFDHVDKTIKVVANARIGPGGAESAYRDAGRRIDEIVSRLQQPPISSIGEIDASGPLNLAFSANCTREQFLQIVLRRQGIHPGRRHLPIRAGTAAEGEFIGRSV